MNKYVKIILGIVLILIGFYIYVAWTGALQALMVILKPIFNPLIKGTLGLIIILIGIIFVILGFKE